MRVLLGEGALTGESREQRRSKVWRKRESERESRLARGKAIPPLGTILSIGTQWEAMLRYNSDVHFTEKLLISP